MGVVSGATTCPLCVVIPDASQVDPPLAQQQLVIADVSDGQVCVCAGSEVRDTEGCFLNNFTGV